MGTAARCPLTGRASSYPIPRYDRLEVIVEQLGSEIPFARFVAESLTEEGFVLIDVGAAGGVAPAWRCFGDKLKGFGFDPDAAEIERLNGVEPAPGFRYVAGYVGLSPDHPFAKE